MKKLIPLLLLSTLITVATAQATERKIEVDSQQSSTHQVKILGKKVKYNTTIGTQPVWDDKGNAVASLHYT